MRQRIFVWVVGAAVVALAAGCGSDSKQSQSPDAAVCQPTTCTAQSKDCGSMPDGCGGVLQCGTCQGNDLCGGGGTANVCGPGGCTPTTCMAEGKNCGVISDDCADVLSCGTCQPPQVCGGDGVANVCGVPPQTDGGVPGPDASTGLCNDTCMNQSGAECCLRCGCGGTVLCYPDCGDYTWDCEIGCCFDYQNLQCV